MQWGQISSNWSVLQSRLLGDSGSNYLSYKSPLADAVKLAVSSFLGDMVNVKFFGAVLDGVTDDTEAFKLAAASGKSFYWVGDAVIDGADPVLFESAVGQRMSGMGLNSRLIAKNATDRVLLACVNGAKNVCFTDFVMIGKNTSEVALASGNTLGGIAVNTDSTGLAHSGIAQEDANIIVDNVFWRGGNGTTQGWNVCLNSNLSEGLIVTRCTMKDIIGTNAGFGYGVTASGDNQFFEMNKIIPLNNSHGRHALYSNGGANKVVQFGNYAKWFQSQAFLSKAQGANTGNDIAFMFNVAEDVCRAGTSTAAGIGHYQSSGYASGGENIRFVHNAVKVSGQHGLYALECENVVSEHNRISDPAHHGIFFDTVDSGESKSDSVKNIDAGFVGIELQECVDVDVITPNVKSATAYRSGIRFNAGGAGNSGCRVINPRIDTNWTIADIENDNQNDNQVTRYQNNAVKADVGDSDVTLVPGNGDAKHQRYATALTANRVVTLSSSGAFEGCEYYITRTTANTFTIDVGGLKTMPASTLCTVHVKYIGGNWRLVGYQVL